MKVCKFGGSSLSDANGVKAAADIVLGDCERKIIVVSAIGKNGEEKIKLTDALIKIYEYSHCGKDCDFLWQNVLKRFKNMQFLLNVDFKADDEIAVLKNGVLYATYDEFVSAGERLTAKLFSQYCGFTVLDAKDVIFKNGNRDFKRQCRQSDKSERGSTIDVNSQDAFFVDTDKVRFLLKNGKGVVIPGFYYSSGGKIRLLKRGGGDVTGAILARSFSCEYENFTDTDGIYCAVPDDFTPKMLETVGYKQLRALSDYGFCVFSKEASEYLIGSGINTRVFNTFTKRGGTIISDSVDIFPFALGEKDGFIAVAFDERYKKVIENFLVENKLLNYAFYTDRNFIKVYCGGDARRNIKRLYLSLIN